MLKEITGDLVEDKDIAIVIRDGYKDSFPDNDINRRLYEKYPKLKENDEHEYKKYGAYSSPGSMSGARMDDDRIIVTWYSGEMAGHPDFDAIVRSANMFNQYLYNRDRDLKIIVGVPEGMCGDQWVTVRQAVGEIANHQPQDEFIIVDDEEDE